RDGDGNASRGADQRALNAAGQRAHVRVEALRLERLKQFDKAQHRAQQAEQWRNLRNGGNEVQLFLQPRNFFRPGLLNGFADAFAILVAMQDGGLDDVRDRARRGITDGDGLDDVVPL